MAANVHPSRSRRDGIGRLEEGLFQRPGRFPAHFLRHSDIFHQALPGEEQPVALRIIRLCEDGLDEGRGIFDQAHEEQNDLTPRFSRTSTAGRRTCLATQPIPGL